FSPNSDGANDTWMIHGIDGIPISQIYIFDRFGKLLKQLDPDGAGWDGTYNGSPMPSTDYWFKIIYIENNQQKEFKANFSLKR
ncbi:T9SS type B sorting domain-containing protein, partial [Pseudofulvibacter geojedonensis]